MGKFKDYLLHQAEQQDLDLGDMIEAIYQQPVGTSRNTGVRPAKQKPDAFTLAKTVKYRFKNGDFCGAQASGQRVLYHDEYFFPDAGAEHRYLGVVKYTREGFVIRWFDGTDDTIMDSAHGRDVLMHTKLLLKH